MTFEQVEPNLWYLLCFVSYAVPAAGRSILLPVTYGSLHLTGTTKEKQTPKCFNIFRTVHLRIILVDNQLDAQFFYNTFIYLNPLHVSSTFVLILRRTTV